MADETKTLAITSVSRANGRVSIKVAGGPPTTYSFFEENEEPSLQDWQPKAGETWTVKVYQTTSKGRTYHNITAVVRQEQSSPAAASNGSTESNGAFRSPEILVRLDVLKLAQEAILASGSTVAPLEVKGFAQEALNLAAIYEAWAWQKTEVYTATLEEPPTTTTAATGSPSTAFWKMAREHWGNQATAQAADWCTDKIGKEFKDLDKHQQWEMVQALKEEMEEVR